MSVRCPQLPFLPGFCFNPHLGQTRFHKSHLFEQSPDKIPILAAKEKPGIGGSPLYGTVPNRYPSVYSRNEVAELPAWIAFDRQVLTFNAFYQETLQEMHGSAFIVRNCKLYFFLEDGTIKIVEPKIENSGIPQGTLIARQRIHFPPPKDNQFYDIIDFNIGREIELYGKVFKLTNCDGFTRNFINRLGIPVPDPIDTPLDPYIVSRKKMLETILPKKPKRTVDKFGKFLAHDRQVLRFYGFWDDRETDGGYCHNLQIHYYLADDTVDIKEVMLDNCGRDSGLMFIKRGKLPKFYEGLPTPGAGDETTVLNVLGPNMQESRFVVDPLNCGKNTVQYYRPQDLAIGAAVNVYGRKIILTDCDPYTKEYYRVKYGIVDFTKMEFPREKTEIISLPLHQRKLPPWNGYGSFEDSAQNCITVEPKQIMRDVKKFLKLDRQGMDSHILRFLARMLSKIESNCSRTFIICYYLADNTISVHETDQHASSCFLTRRQIRMPGQEVFTSEPPDCYEPHHLFIGARININEFDFVLIDADEYALRYMELHPHEFPKSNVNIALDKVREKLRPIYKDFVAQHLPNEQPVIPFEILRNKICSVMGDDWSEQEMVTLARHFSAICRTERYSRTYIRQLVLTELKRMLWDGMDRLKEFFAAKDTQRTGYLPRKDVYTLLRGCRIPLDVELLNHMLDVIRKNECCDIEGKDLFNFLNRNYCPMADVVPLNIKNVLWWASEAEPVAGRLIDWCKFNKALDLQHTFEEAPPVEPTIVV